MNKKIIKSLITLASLLLLTFFQYKSGGLTTFSKHVSKNLALEHCVINEQSEEKNIFKVLDVIDGDTIDILKNCQSIRLRLIGINTPETVDPRKSVQCFGPEASAEAKKVLSNKIVRIESDPTQGQYDKYGRTLAYVFLASFSDQEYLQSYNDFMIRQGFAYEYTYNKKVYRYQSQFKNAEREAKENQRGLWSSLNCNGKF